MGMFDTVVIEGLKLPKLPKEVNDFLKESGKELPNDYQTKDLDSVMSTYTINKDGQIYLTEYVPTGKKIPFKPLTNDWIVNRSFLENLYFKFRKLKFNREYPDLNLVDERKPVKVKSKITNTFEIYSYNEFSNRYVDISFEINAENGKVKKIKLKNAAIEPEKDSLDRAKQNKEFQANLAKSIQKQTEFRSKWYYPVLREVYNPFVFFSAKLIQSTCNLLIKSTYRWRGV